MSTESADVIPLAARPPGGVTPQATTEKGVSFGGGGMPFGMFQNEVTNEDRASIAEIQRMLRKDGQARGIYRYLTLPIRTALKEFQIVPGEGDKGEAEFCELMLTLPPAGGGMSVSLSMVLRKILLAIRDGFSAFNVVLQVPETGPLAGKLTIGKISHRPAHTVTFLTNDHGGYAGFKQRTTFKGEVVDVTIKPDESFYYAVNEEENPFYGVSPMLPVYYHYDKKVKLYYIAHIAAQLAATGLRIGKIPEGADPTEAKLFRDMINSAAFNTSWTMLDKYGIEVVKLGGDMAAFDTLFKHHNTQMARSALIAFSDGADRTVLIDNSANAPEDITIMSLDAIMDEIAETITNHLLAKVVAKNFNDPVYPTFKFGQIADATREAFRTLFSTLFKEASALPPAMRLAMLKKIAKSLELGVEEEDIEEEFEEAEEEAAQMKEDMKKAEEEALKNPAGAAAPGSPAKVAAKAPVAPAGTPQRPDGKAPVQLSEAFLKAEETAGIHLSFEEVIEDVKRIVAEYDDGQEPPA